MRRARRAVTALGVASLALAARLPAQDSTAALRVFLDCQTAWCDFDFLRVEITWVNWMRDRSDADVHVLVTSQQTGGGGREYTFQFIGLRSHAGREDRMQATSSSTATDDEQRRIVSRTLALGLVPFAARTGLAGRLAVRLEGPGGGRTPGSEPRDRWKQWVFTLGMDGWLSGQSRSSFTNLNGSAEVKRVTEPLKVRLRFSHSWSHSEFEFDDGERFESTTRNSSGSFTWARSVGDHWTLGLFAQARSSDPENLDLSLRAQPGVEWSVWPYRESTRRLLTLTWEVGGIRFDYADTTIFGKLRETRPQHTLTGALSSQQPWGQAYMSVGWSNFLDDWSRNRLQVSSSISVRLVKGLQVNLYGAYSRVRDQLYLAKAGVTDEEVLLQLRRLQTSYEYWASVGVSYTFGSIFNNIVNPRYQNAGGQGGFH